MSSTTVDWSDLPPDLLGTIAKNLKIHADYIRFRAVCTRWRAAAPAAALHLPCQFPWLMLHHRQSSRFPNRRGFFNLLYNKLHLLQLPESSFSRRRAGSSHGWLVILDESPTIFLLNPLTRAKITLPPLFTFPNVVSFDFYSVGREYTLCEPDGKVYYCNLKEMRDSFIKKAILSRSPFNDSEFTAFAILSQSGDLAYCKRGQSSWNIIDEARSYSEDVIYVNGSFYAVNKFGSIAICDVNGDVPKVSFIEMPRQIGGDMQYLVNVMGEFLLITRFLTETDIAHLHYPFGIVYRTAEFRVLRLNLSGPKWEKVASLDDKVLFLGENSSLGLLASDYPGCKGNRIYFTDDYSVANYDGISGAHDIGIYNLEDGSIEALPCYPHDSHYWSCAPPPIWITPNPC